MKKIKYPPVKYSKWETPVSNILYVDLLVVGVLQTIHITYFFMFKADENKKVYVLSIPRHFPYRIMEEEYAHHGVRRYFRKKRPLKQKNGSLVTSCAWRLWNTDMIKELNAGEALSDFGKTKIDEITHYVIETGGDTIEFISPVYHWEIHKNIKAKDLIQSYVKNRFYDVWGKRAKNKIAS